MCEPAEVMLGPTNAGLGICPCECTCGPSCDHQTCPCDECVAHRTPPPTAAKPVVCPACGCLVCACAEYAKAREALAESTTNPYELKKAARVARLRERAASRSSAASSARASAAAIADRIPFGQPVLLGHHSERRHRRDMARIDNGFRKSFALADEAQELARRADRLESSTAISSDDPEAVGKLREKIADERANVEAMKVANKVLRKAAMLDRATIAKVAELLGWPADKTAAHLGVMRSMGIRTFSTANTNANIRRLEQRIEILTKRAATTSEPEQIGSVRIEEADNRVRIYFPAKPNEALRSRLKRAGFRWAPSEGAWQRQPGSFTGIRAFAQEIARDFEEHARIALLIEERPDTCDGCKKTASVTAEERFRGSWTCYGCGRVNIRRGGPQTSPGA